MKKTLFAVRSATEEDASAIAGLADELGYPTPLETMRGRVGAILASPADLLLVAADASNEPVAWLQAHSAHILESGFRVEIVGLIVSPKVRRQGVGRLLLEEAERWAAKIEAQAVVVRSNANRLESHAFIRPWVLAGLRRSMFIGKVCRPQVGDGVRLNVEKPVDSRIHTNDRA